MTTKRSGSINLTALGSAAVMAVFAAGYLRTSPAARRFEGNDSDRRPVVTRPVVAINADSLHDTLKTIAVVVDSTPSVRVTKPDVKAKVTEAPATKDSSAPAAPLSTATPAPAAPAPIDTVKAAVADTVKVLKDGTYTGWGTSRHGDIEAAVEIKNGRIASAYITQCLTRYSCSRIASIIPQVVERQSANVDYVSGATQSTDAFYYAIVEALSKAK